jgi:hypothetical protein
MTISPLTQGYHQQKLSLMSVGELMELFDNGRLLDHDTRRSFSCMPNNGTVLMDILMNQYQGNLPILTLNHNYILEKNANNEEATWFAIFIATLNIELATLSEQRVNNPFFHVLNRYASHDICTAYKQADEDARITFEQRLFCFQVPIVLI